ncbi:MAG: hypothetical protein GX672_04180, partial [Synergistaceae bacterium]|nr:hypothetical protein [Synergistaceae bacterium]
KNKTDYSLQDFIDAKYEDTMSTENAKCPSNGIYSEGEENGREVVLCSVHYPTPGAGDEPGGGDTPGGGLPAGSFYIPGTGDTIVGSGDWTAPGIVRVDHSGSWAGTYVNFNKNDKFTYKISGKDEYYIAVTDSNADGHVDSIYVAGDHPDLTPDGLPASAYSYGYGLVKFTGVSKNWENILNGDKFYRGDVIYYNGDYYVLMNALGVAYPITKNQDWSNSPDKDPGTWYKLSN